MSPASLSGMQLHFLHAYSDIQYMYILSKDEMELEASLWLRITFAI